MALAAGEPVTLWLRGGTDVTRAPPWDYFAHVFLDWLGRLGAEVEIRRVRRGYYPRGGGEVELAVTPWRGPHPLDARSPGRLVALEGWAHVASLPLAIASRMAQAAEAVLAPRHAEIAVRALKEEEAYGAGGAIVLAARTEHGVLGAGAVAARGVPAEALGLDAASALKAELDAGAAVDVHAADQLLPYCALARGISRLTVRRASLHAETLFWLLPQFLPVTLSRRVNREGLVEITVRRD